MASSKRVVGVPELLELILEYADARDIFCWQRVDKEWQSVIQRSHGIQDKIHFRSAVYKPTRSLDNHDGDAIVEVEWNPIISYHERQDSVEYTVMRGQLQERRSEISSLRVQLLQDLDAGHPEASWKPIFITKPALQEAIIRWYDPRLGCLFQDRLRSEGGITLGDLSQARKKYLARALRAISSFYMLSFSQGKCFPYTRLTHYFAHRP